MISMSIKVVRLFFLRIAEPGPVGVADTIFDVRFGVVLFVCVAAMQDL